MVAIDDDNDDDKKVTMMKNKKKQPAGKKYTYTSPVQTTKFVFFFKTLEILRKKLGGGVGGKGKKGKQTMEKRKFFKRKCFPP